MSPTMDELIEAAAKAPRPRITKQEKAVIAEISKVCSQELKKTKK